MYGLDLIKKSFKELNIKLHYLNGILVVDIENESSSDLSYACYLYADEKIIEKKAYSKKCKFSFDLPKTGNYKVRLYLRCNRTSERGAKNFDVGIITKYSKFYTTNEKKFLNDQNINFGATLVNESKIVFKGFNPVELPKDGVNLFQIDPFKNRTWRWNLLQLSVLNQILSIYSKSLDKSLFEKAFELIQSWDKYSQFYTEDKELWHDHGTALRLENICFFFSYSLKENLIQKNSKEYLYLFSLIEQHINILFDENFYSIHTNHGFDQSLIMYQVCMELDYLKDFSQYVKVAEKRIIQEINHAFCKDGGHKENSPAYLNFGIKQCLLAINLEKNYTNEVNEFRYVNEVVDLATKALIHAIKPNGMLPLIGDTSNFKVNNIFGDFRPKDYSGFLYSVFKGTRGEKPIDKFYVLPETGYVFYRSHWEKENFSDAVFFSMKAGYKSNYHRHDDDLSITLYGYGEDWLVDGGIYKYANTDPNRKYIRSHLSHNLMSVDNIVAQRNIDNKHYIFMGNSTENNGKYSVFAESEMFKDFRIKRTVEIIDETFNIYDSCLSLKEGLFKVTSRLFFNDDKVVFINGDSIEIIGKHKKLKIDIVSDEELEVNLNSIQNNIVGMLSRENNKLYKAHVVEIRPKNYLSDTVTFKMNMNFMDLE